MEKFKTLRDYGFPLDQKLLMIHADDAGLSHSENRATIKALESGSVSSYSIMVPCPGFREMAEFAIKNRQFDTGIHLTLTCEWETYGFGPVLPAKEVPGLVDEKGHFYKTRELLKNSATPSEVREELDAQIQKAIASGIQPTHLDSHMYSVSSRGEYLDIYRDLGRKYDLPVFLNRELIIDMGLDPDTCLRADDLVADQLFLGTYADFRQGNLEVYYDKVLDNLPAGFNVLILHPAYDDQEMRQITINHPNFGSVWRQTDFDYFTSEKCRTKLQENRIQLITWGEIRKAIKSMA